MKKTIRDFDLKDKTIGIIGGGRIGLHVARMARSFGMHVRVYDIHQDYFLSELINFNIHDNPYCVFVKSFDGVWQHCIERQGKVLVVDPRECFGVDTIKRDKIGMEKLYQLGYRDGKRIEDFVNAAKTESK